MHIYVKPNQDSVFCFFIIFFTCNFFFFFLKNCLQLYPWIIPERERDNFILFRPQQRSLLKNSTTLKFHKNVKHRCKKSELFFSSQNLFFFFFFSLAHKISSNNKQITVITILSAYTNLKLNVKSLKIINQTQDKADKQQAKNEKKKNP